MAIRDLIWTGTRFDTIDADTLDSNDSSAFLLKSGGSVTGSGITMNNASIAFNTNQTGLTWSMNTDGAGIRFNSLNDQDMNACLEFYTLDNGNEFFKWSHRMSGATDTIEWMTLKSDGLRVNGNLVYHAGNKPTPADIGAAPTHSHNYVSSTGGSYNAGYSLKNLTLTDYGTPFECSQYIDFHAAGSNVDYSVRLTGTSGALSCSGTFTATKVFNAVWNDYAELFLKEDNSVEAGDILAYGESGVLKATKETCKAVVGVYSDSYGHLMGGDEGKSEEENLVTYAPVGLAGQVYVKVNGSISKGDLITASDIPGVGCKSETYVPGTIVGKALESYTGDSIKRIKMLIMNI